MVPAEALGLDPGAEVFALESRLAWRGGHRSPDRDEGAAQPVAALPGDRPGGAPGRVDRLQRVPTFLGQRSGCGADGQAGVAPRLDLSGLPAEGPLVLHPDPDGEAIPD